MVDWWEGEGGCLGYVESLRGGWLGGEWMSGWMREGREGGRKEGREEGMGEGREEGMGEGREEDRLLWVSVLSLDITSLPPPGPPNIPGMNE